MNRAYIAEPRAIRAGRERRVSAIKNSMTGGKMISTEELKNELEEITVRVDSLRGYL